MLVGDQVICEMFSSKMTSLVAGSITTVTCHSSPTEPFFSMHFRGTQVARRPAKDRLLLTQGTRNVRNDTLFFSTIAHLVGRTLRKIQCIFFIETLKNTITAMLKILWKITWKRNIMAPQIPFQRNLTEILFGSFSYPHIHLTSADPLCFWKLHRLVVSHLLHLFHLTLEKRMSNSSHGFVEKLDRNLFETWAYG